MRIRFTNTGYSVAKAVPILQRGGVIIYPTDTIYGIGCDIGHLEVVREIYRIKERDAKKPMSIICADLKMAGEYARISNTAFGIMKRALPGPYTFILKAQRKTPITVLSRKKTVGIRIPDHDACLEMVRQLGNPIITTSVNISGSRAVERIEDIPESILASAELIIDAGPLENDASTVIDLSGDAPVVLRQGKGALEPLGL